LARNQIPYRWLDIEVSDEAKQYVELVSMDNLRLPLLVFPDGTTLLNPTSREIADKIGLKTRPENPFYDVIIIGGGPAGLAAGVYGASEGLRTVIVEKSAPGGQAGTSSRIENYLGFPVGLSGADLARRAVAQARRFGAEILTPQSASSIRLEEPYRILTLEDGTELSAHVILIATGVSYYRLEAPGVDTFTGAGVYYGAALSEALNYVGQDVVIVGAGNSAGQAAMYFSKYARNVIMLVRDTWLGKTMSQYLVNYIEATPNISVRVNHEVAAARGVNHLEEVDILNNNTGDQETIQTSALFIFIGAKPQTGWLGDVIERDTYGFIQHGGNGYRPRGWPLERDPYMFETNIPGIFVAGDARIGSVKRVATAVGEGAMAIQFIHKYLGGL
ncbi:MAG: FAD-dependent oxidoreductase, partial [Burkholderiales bacterium]|nr:FAD-dependent oxidoreductase [Anaerolineae bacterium]